MNRKLIEDDLIYSEDQRRGVSILQGRFYRNNILNLELHRKGFSKRGGHHEIVLSPHLLHHLSHSPLYLSDLNLSTVTIVGKEIRATLEVGNTASGSKSLDSGSDCSWAGETLEGDQVSGETSNVRSS